MRNKKLNTDSVKNVLVITLTRIGDAIVSIPAFRAIKETLPRVKVTALINSYSKDIYERIGYIDNIATYEENSSFFQKSKLVKKLSSSNFDLAIDLTCDYTFEGALWTYISGAKYRIGYNIFSRGFLFNWTVKHNKFPVHIVDEILNIFRSVGIDTRDKQPRISASEEAKETITHFLQEKDASNENLLIGVHPGGYYKTQCWPYERFALVSDEVIEKYNAKIVLIGSLEEDTLIKKVKAKMNNKPIVFLGQPLKYLIALIERCDLLICNNSGPLYIAVAVGTPTVSTMGPTIHWRWWPQGKEHVVIRKNLACMPCNEGYCRLKTNECMELITVQEVLDGVAVQLSRITNKKDEMS